MVLFFTTMSAEQNSDAGLRILLLDDDPFDVELIQKCLQDNFDCVVTIAVTQAELLAELERMIPDVVIADSNIPRFSGMAALELIQQLHPRAPFIFCSGNTNPELRAKALECGAKAWVSKDDLLRLVAVIKRVCAV